MTPDERKALFSLLNALAEAEAKLAKVRSILAGTGIGSLPNDYPIERLALETWNTLQERTLEGLALIGKAEGLESRDWQPIETAPIDGTPILVFGGNPSEVYGYGSDNFENRTIMMAVAWCKGPNWRFADYDSRYYGQWPKPTHWMPLPPPPKATP